MCIKQWNSFFYDMSIGMAIKCAKGTLDFMFVPYEMLILSVFKKLRILPIQNSHFLIFPIIAYGLSSLLPSSWVKKMMSI